jgi:nicotinamidase-related amidase
MTEALIVVDAQNEFSSGGKRPVPNHATALVTIIDHVHRARHDSRPIAWIRHHNKSDESPAFVPHSWGAEFSPGCGPDQGMDRSSSSKKMSMAPSPAQSLSRGFARSAPTRS